MAGGIKNKSWPLSPESCEDETSFLLCQRLVHPIAYLVPVLSVFQDLKGEKDLRSNCDMINLKEGDEFTSLGFLMAVAYSEGMLCPRKLSLFPILMYPPVIYMLLIVSY